MSNPTPELKEGTTWTTLDENALHWYVARLPGGDLANADAALFAREIIRLRSENDGMRGVAEIRRQRDAWRDYADHLDHCVECSQMGPIGDCFKRKELQEATKCSRCGGSARLLPDVECPICAESRR